MSTVVSPTRSARRGHEHHQPWPRLVWHGLLPRLRGRLLRQPDRGVPVPARARGGWPPGRRRALIDLSPRCRRSTRSSCSPAASRCTSPRAPSPRATSAAYRRPGAHGAAWRDLPERPGYEYTHYALRPVHRHLRLDLLHADRLPRRARHRRRALPAGLLLPLAYVATSRKDQHFAVTAVEMYWHFVDVVWVILFSVLYLL